MEVEISLKNIKEKMTDLGYKLNDTFDAAPDSVKALMAFTAVAIAISTIVAIVWFLTIIGRIFGHGWGWGMGGCIVLYLMIYIGMKCEC